MKIGLECAFCIVHRAWREAVRATQDPELQFRALKAVIDMLSREFTPDATPAYLGTLRDRIIKEVTGNPDPYKEVKERANRLALELLPEVRRISDGLSGYEKFRFLCKVACLGNVLDFDIYGHKPSGDVIRSGLETIRFAVDDTREIYEKLKSVSHVLYLTDNAGEIAFDRLLVEELKNMGLNVSVCVRGGPVINDATLEDARLVGMFDVADEVLTNGGDVVGVIPDLCSEEFMQKFRSAEFILAKGMANFETVTDVGTPCPTAFLFRTKCGNIAGRIGVEVGVEVAMLVEEGFRIT